MSETSFYGYCKEIDYREFDNPVLKDVVVVKIGTHRLLKVSQLGGWVSYTGSILTDEELAQVAESMIDPT
nr:MAG TPA: hypothetical protein [Caudoviricetes sp.]